MLSATTLFVIFGSFLEFIAAVSLSRPARWRRMRSPRDVQPSHPAVSLAYLWLGICCQTTSVLLPQTRDLMLSPTTTWVALCGAACLLAWVVFLTLSPSRQVVTASVGTWLRRRHNDTSGVPSEIARKLQKKTKLPRRPNESDLDYIHRCRDHIIRRLNQGQR